MKSRNDYALLLDLEEQGNRAASYWLQADRLISRAERRDSGELTTAEQAEVDRLVAAAETASDRYELKAAVTPGAPLTRRPVVGRSIADHRADIARLSNRVAAPPTPPCRASAADVRADALHEAAHAVAYVARGAVISRVQIDRTYGGGSCSAVPSDDAVAALAGAAAEQFAGFDGGPSESDLAIASRAFESRDRAPETWSPVAELEASRLVRSCWPAIASVANALLAKGSLSHGEVVDAARFGTAVAVYRLSQATHRHPKSQGTWIPGVTFAIAA